MLDFKLKQFKKRKREGFTEFHSNTTLKMMTYMLLYNNAIEWFT